MLLEESEMEQKMTSQSAFKAYRDAESSWNLNTLNGSLHFISLAAL